MKITKLLTLGILCASVSFANAKQVTAVMQVTATIVGNCSVNAGQFALSYGDGSKDDDGYTNVQVSCNSGLPYVVQFGNGYAGSVNDAKTSRIMLHSSDNTQKLKYQLYKNSDRTTILADLENISGVGTGTVQNHPVYYRALAGQKPMKGSYSDAVEIIVVF